jgi:tRNA U34 5-methylaminomethyl-2-thiouridine-forming methyltransferase MnmC
MIFKPLSMMDQKPNGISVMLMIHMPRSGTISAAMKSHKASLRLTQWKQIMQNCAITWLAWQDHPAVSLAVRMHSTVLSAYSFTATTVANSKAVNSQITLFTSSTSLTH